MKGVDFARGGMSFTWDPWMWIIIAAIGAVSMICALVLFLALKKKKTFV